MLIVKPKAFGFDGEISSGTSVSGAIVSGAIVSGTFVVGTLFTPLPASARTSSNRAPATKHGRAPHRRRALVAGCVPEHHLLAGIPALECCVRSSFS